MTKSIYFDNNATTLLDERVLEAMLPYLRRVGNASSVHHFGRSVRGAIEQARIQVAQLVNAHPSQVIFTSGGSEANNLALKGSLACYSSGRLAISAIEHDSVLKTANSFKSPGWEVMSLPVDQQGRIDLPGLATAFAPNLRLVSVMMANNENGVIQDVMAIGPKLRAQGVWFHTDATQAAGKISVDFLAMQAHLMTLSAHKIYGPQGIGALIYDRALEITPLIHGGGQESGLRSGTENIAAIVGFGQAAELARLELAERTAKTQALQQQLETALAALPQVTVFSQKAQRLPNTSLFAVTGIEGEMLLMSLDRAGFAVSSGSACASGTGLPSHVLRAMNVPKSLADSVIRVSFGKANTSAEVTAFIAALKQILATLDYTLRRA